VQTISAIVAAARPRPAGTDLSLFKPMGMGLSDVALGIEILRRAQASGTGRALPHPGFANPRISISAKEETAA